VREDIRVRADGQALVRTLRPETGADAAWWRVVDGTPAQALARNAAGAFVIELPLGKAAP
jgi:hypothetical protein